MLWYNQCFIGSKMIGFCYITWMGNDSFTARSVSYKAKTTIPIIFKVAATFHIIHCYRNIFLGIIFKVIRREDIYHDFSHQMAELQKHFVSECYCPSCIKDIGFGGDSFRLVWFYAP